VNLPLLLPAISGRFARGEGLLTITGVNPYLTLDQTRPDWRVCGVVRFLLLVVGMAATVAGCAQQPVAYMVYPPAGAQYQYPAAGIDHVVYGTGGPYVPSRPAVAYAPPPNPAPGPVQISR
jgi:hypothetical protein